VKALHSGRRTTCRTAADQTCTGAQCPRRACPVPALTSTRRVQQRPCDPKQARYRQIRISIARRRRTHAYFAALMHTECSELSIASTMATSGLPTGFTAPEGTLRMRLASGLNIKFRITRRRLHCQCAHEFSAARTCFGHQPFASAALHMGIEPTQGEY
jgi:hypothetical protein